MYSAVIAPDCLPPMPMKSRKTNSRMNVKCRRTGTPRIWTVPTLPAAARDLTFSSLLTHPFDAMEGCEVPRRKYHAAAAPPMALRWRISLRYFHRNLRYFHVYFICRIVMRLDSKLVFHYGLRSPSR